MKGKTEKGSSVNDIIFIFAGYNFLSEILNWKWAYEKGASLMKNSIPYHNNSGKATIHEIEVRARKSRGLREVMDAERNKNPV